MILHESNAVTIPSSFKNFIKTLSTIQNLKTQHGDHFNNELTEFLQKVFHDMCHYIDTKLPTLGSDILVILHSPTQHAAG